ncbi:MAG TPA: DUF2461 domain-containing protein [Flavobacteriales bacterium]|nr:DUF2461 domain-containing protein [Flavobacteriales bacterium]HOY29456.1 DUF2461 domain-containing protein [Flavobacteriales bacterium]
MAWFTPDFNKFFIDLAPNNNKEWFDANRKRYEQSVKEPFEAFVAEVIKQVAKVDPKVNITPREAIFRINRDVRFSKDKAPYKSRMSAVVAAGGRKDHSTGGIYFELGPENVAFYGGQYMPEKEQLQGIREHIAANLARFKKLRTAKAFVDRFEGIQGERNKIVPKEFKEAALKEPLIANKQFYFMAELPPSTVSDPKLVQILLDHYKAMKPMNDFLAEGQRRG